MRGQGSSWESRWDRCGNPADRKHNGARDRGWGHMDVFERHVTVGAAITE